MTVVRYNGKIARGLSGKPLEYIAAAPYPTDGLVERWDFSGDSYVGSIQPHNGIAGVIMIAFKE